MDVVGFGALNLDQIYGVKTVPSSLAQVGSERQLQPDETRQFRSFLSRHARLIVRSGGGSAANTVYALAKMGHRCGFVGRAGTDSEGDYLISELEQAGIDTSHITRTGQSGTCFILVDRMGERTSIVSANRGEETNTTDQQVDYMNSARFLHLSSLAGTTGLEIQKQAIKQVNVATSVDPGALYATRGYRELGQLISKSRILFCTEEEAELLGGRPWKQAAHLLMQLGPEVVAIKRSSKGSTVLFENEIVNVPARKTAVIDPTGAGDVYAAGFLTGILHALHYEKCAILANTLAAQSITGYGRSSYPDATFLSRFINEHQCKDVLQ